MLIEIKSWLNGEVLFSHEAETIKDAVQVAVERKINLSNADLRYADLINADLRYADLINADLSNANLSNADLRYADLINANLSNADLINANLINADLINADLRYANLINANLSNANLINADLSNADLSNANLINADLINADLRYANLDEKHFFMSISLIGSENGCLWVMKNENGVLIYNRGCFSGTKEKFIDAVKNKHAGTDHETIYTAAVEFIELCYSLKTKSHGIERS